MYDRKTSHREWLAGYAFQSPPYLSCSCVFFLQSPLVNCPVLDLHSRTRRAPLPDTGCFYHNPNRLMALQYPPTTHAVF